MSFHKSIAALSVGASFLVSASLADAADFVAPEIDWSGFYVGAHAGYGDAEFDGALDIGDFEQGDEDSTIFLEDLDANGFVGGIHAGWNHQFDSFVLGIEADASFADLDDEAFEPEDANEVAEADLDLLASLRLRAGWAVDGC